MAKEAWSRFRKGTLLFIQGDTIWRRRTLSAPTLTNLLNMQKSQYWRGLLFKGLKFMTSKPWSVHSLEGNRKKNSKLGLSDGIWANAWVVCDRLGVDTRASKNHFKRANSSSLRARATAKTTIRKCSKLKLAWKVLNIPLWMYPTYSMSFCSVGAW